MSAETVAESGSGEAGALFCYRHPERQTYISCGRCDRPICASCAMLGPVGARCTECGKHAFDPLTSFTPLELAGGVGVALGGGLIGGFVGLQIGFFFALCLGPLVGGFIAEGVMRVTGYKRGSMMGAIVFGGIAFGAIAAMTYNLSILAGATGGLPIEIFLQGYATSALVYVAAAAIGASWRLR
ncbi:MAG: hypothetical protein L0221_03580 [Chloroflexi bacterium]|nr:hypothetical protein [Chloroflexota bacterium]